MASTTSGTDTECPVQTLISKKLRALRKKLARISQLEQSQSTKPLNKEQSDLVSSKYQIVAIIEEFEKLRQPLQVAVQEELSQKDSIVEDLVKVLYFGSLFDVKNQNEFANVMLTRIHERGCCLTYDYVGDDDKELLEEDDLDLISKVGNLMISKDVSLKVSHKMAVEECVKRAKLWVEKSELPICPNTEITYVGLREKLNKIISLDYFTTTPEMKAPVDVAAAAYNINPGNFAETGSVHTEHEVQINGSPDLNQHMDLGVCGTVVEACLKKKEIVFFFWEEGEEEVQEIEGKDDRSIPQHAPDETEKKEESTEQVKSQDNSDLEEIGKEERANDIEHNQKESELKEQQRQRYSPRRGYQNQRGGASRGYSNGRGGARRGRGGVYQNGGGQQQHFNDSRYYFNSNNGRGRGGGREPATHNGYSHGGRVELSTSS